jgi:hypothetical protein
LSSLSKFSLTTLSALAYLIPQLRDPQYGMEIWDRWKNEANNIISQNKGTFKKLFPWQQETIWDWSRFHHAYLTINEVAPGSESYTERVWGSINVFMGGNSKVEGREVTFSSDDQVTVLEPEIQIALEKLGIKGAGVIAVTKHHHALSGALMHLCIDADGRRFMVRAGAGQYPIPVLRTFVDLLNSVLGGPVWQMTDWVYDYKKMGPDEFEKFYSEDTRIKVELLLNDQKMYWVLHNSDFSTDYFQNSPNEQHVYFLRQAVQFGYFSRTAQDYYLKYLKSDNRQNWFSSKRNDDR